jgi:flagellar protein FlbT
MLMYLDEEEASKYYDEFVLRMTEFMAVVSDPEVLARCVEISTDVMNRNFYRALMNCKKLLPFEEQRLNYVAQGLPKGANVG